MKRRLVMFLCGLAACLGGLAQQEDAVKTLAFESLTIDDGLSQGMVNGIIQDRFGFMWFATKDGLNRYDGYKFVIYRHNPADKNSLADNYVFAVFEDSKGRFWVGTGSKGLDLFDRETETFIHFRHDEKNSRSIPSDHILRIAEDADGFIYISTNKGLSTIQVTVDQNGKEHFQFTTIDPCAECKVFSPGKGRVWIAPGPDTLYALNRKQNDSLVRGDIFYQKKPDGTIAPIYLQNVQAFAHHPKEQFIYLAQETGIWRYDQESGWIEDISKGRYTGRLVSHPVILDTAGYLWISDFGNQRLFDIRKGTTQLIQADNPRHAPIISSANYLFKDRGGFIWIGSKGYGLLKYNPRFEKFRHRDHESIKWMSEDASGRVLVVKVGENAWVFDPKKDEYTGQIPNLPRTVPFGVPWVPEDHPLSERWQSGLIDALVQDENEIYWLGKQNLLGYDDTKKRIEYTAFDRRFCFPLHLDQDLVWMGAPDAFTSYHKINKQFTRYPYPITTDHSPYKFIQAIHQQGDVFWLGTIKGLFRFDPSSREWTQFKNNPEDTTSLSFDLIFSLCPDPRSPDQYLWVGANGGGLNRFEYATGKFIHFTTRDGLPNDVVYGILSDNDGYLWMSTNRGISRFDPDTRSFRNFEAKDGLQSNEFNRNAFCKTRDGMLFFGGVNGFNYFNPREIGDNAHPPNMVITDFKIGNKSIHHHSSGLLKKPIYLTDKIAILYKDNMISFEFAAMDFAQPEKNRYQYKLEGFDKDWIQSGFRNSATYTNLDPGGYTFWVKGSNSDGFWNENPAFVQLVVLPPWYMTWWFRSLLGATVLAAAYAFYRFRLQQALKLQAIRNKIASDLHDEIGSNLSTISIFSDVAKAQSEGSQIATLLGKISSYTQESMEAMSDIVWMINATNDRFENIIIRMRELAVELIEAKGAALQLTIDEPLNALKLGMQERKNFWLIYKEALNNIAKYANAKQVWICLDYENGHISLDIKDDGTGFSRSHLGSGNGLKNMHLRAEALKGKLKIISAPGEGTEVRLIFKI